MDALGREITPGDLVIYTGQKSSGFAVSVIKEVKASRVSLINPGYGPSRKEKDNVIVITEEQLINKMRASINLDADGMFRQQIWTRERDENGRPIYEHIEFTFEERLHDLTKGYIQLSRIIKQIPLEEYEPTPQEREKLKL